MTSYPQPHRFNGPSYQYYFFIAIAAIILVSFTMTFSTSPWTTLFPATNTSSPSSLYQFNDTVLSTKQELINKLLGISEYTTITSMKRHLSHEEEDIIDSKSNTLTTTATRSCPPNSEYEKLATTITGEESGDQSGWSIALSSDGQYLAIGAPYNDDVSGINSGHVRIYKRVEKNKENTNAMKWEQVGAEIDGLHEGDGFGWSLAISDDGSIVAASAIYSSGDGKRWSGQVRVFSRKESSNNILWKQVGKSINGKFSYDYFGSSLSLSSDGSILAIGADESDGGGQNNGSMRVFIRDTSTDIGWKQIGSDINGNDYGDAIGGSVSLSSDGMVLAIGSHLEVDFGNDVIGRVRVFEQDPTLSLGWKQIGQDLDGEAECQSSSKTVALSNMGDVIAIGSKKNHGNGKWSSKLRVFHVDSSTELGWTQVGSDLDGESSFDYSGHSITLSADGTVLVIGTTLSDTDGKDNTGHVRMYRRDLGSKLGWTQVGHDLHGLDVDSYAGYSVDLSADGSTLAVGAPGIPPSEGYVQVYQVPCLANTTGLKSSNKSSIIIAVVTGGLAVIAIAIALLVIRKRSKGKDNSHPFTIPARAYEFL